MAVTDKPEVDEALEGNSSGTPMPGSPSVVLSHVSVTYETAVKNSLINGDQQGVGGLKQYLPGSRKQVVNAVTDVSTVIRTGESVAFVGSNGAGKSTLLRTIAGVEHPTSGQILVSSQPQLQGVGAAMIPLLSGLQNIRIGCLAMGMDPGEIPEATKYVRDLAGIGDAIYRPMNTYSAGMRARLLFSINAASRPEILLIDEALGTGDATFTARAEKAMGEIRDNAGTVIMVSHFLKNVERMCERSIWMHQGKIIADGQTKEILKDYRAWANRQAKGLPEKAAAVIEKHVSTYRPVEVELVTGRDVGGADL